MHYNFRLFWRTFYRSFFNWKNSPAPLNLPVPPYHYVTDALLRVGEAAGGKEQQWQPATW